MEKYNGWEDPEWRDYWGMNDDDSYDDDYIDEGAPSESEISDWMNMNDE